MTVADRHLWLTADQARVVESGDPAAAFLLVAGGTEIPADEMSRLGLMEHEGKVILPVAGPTAGVSGGAPDGVTGPPGVAPAVVQDTAPPAEQQGEPKARRRRAKASR